MHEEVQSKEFLATQGRRRFEAKQKWPRNRPKQPKNGTKLAIFGCASEQGATDSPVPPGGFQGAEMADILLRSRRSPR
ncbi:hypothetical protein NP199_24390, partial [Salmonella enterica]|nr:hypothetical protein [Salmonella enterica]